MIRFSLILFFRIFFFFLYSCNKQVAFYVGKGLIVFLSQSFLVLFFFSLPCIHSFRFNLQLKHTYSIFDTIVRLKLLKKKKKKNMLSLRNCNRARKPQEQTRRKRFESRSFVSKIRNANRFSLNDHWKICRK